MIPTRAATALLATVFGLALLLSFKTPTTPSLAAGTNADSAIVGDAAASAAPPTTSTEEAATVDEGATTDGSVATPTAEPTDASSGAYADGTYSGSVIRTRFGDVQVEVTISGGVLADVAALELPSGDRHSAAISEGVAPILREEALTAQDANIDLLSGATYTSSAYAESLQAALDAAAA